MYKNLKIYLFLSIPFVITLLYCIAIVLWSDQNLSDFLKLADIYAFIILTLWMLMGASFLIIDLIKQSINRNSEPIDKYFLRLLIHARRPSTQILYLTPPLILILLLSAYGLFKQTAIPQTGFWAGPQIMELERKILYGHDAWQVTHALLPMSASYWLDQAYQAWMVLMAASMLICSYLSSNPLQRSRFMLCFISTWIITGTALAYLIPAAGPIYMAHFHPGHDPFAALKVTLAAENAQLHRVYGDGILSIRSQALLLERFKSGIITAGGGISAMPSMHNAIAVLLACSGLSINRWLGSILTAFAITIFIGSVHLGWHYALDGVIAAALSIAMWRSSGRMLARYERRQRDRRFGRAGGRRTRDPKTAPAASVSS